MVSLKQATKVYDLMSAELRVEAAICTAMELPYRDKPTCVGLADQAFSLTMDSAQWSCTEARMKGMRNLSVAQLGSDRLTKVQQHKWTCLIVSGVTQKIVPIILRIAASVHHDKLRASNLTAVAAKFAQGPTQAEMEAELLIVAKAAIAADGGDAAISAAAHAVVATAVNATYSKGEAAASMVADIARAVSRESRDADAIRSAMTEIAVEAYATIGATGASLLARVLHNIKGQKI